MEFEEVEFVHPDGSTEIFEFEVGTPDEVISSVFQKYGQELSGQRGALPGSEAGQGALPGLEQTGLGGAPAPAPPGGGPPGVDVLQPPEVEPISEATWDTAAGVVFPRRDPISTLLRFIMPTEFGKGVASMTPAAAATIPETMGAAVDSAAGVPFTADESAAMMRERVADPLYGAADRLARLGQYVPPPETGTLKDVWDDPSAPAFWNWFTYNIGQQVPIIGGIVTAFATGGPAAAYVAASTLQTGMQSRELRELGKHAPGKALAIGLITGGMEFLPIARLFGRVKHADRGFMPWLVKKLAHMGRQAIEEGLTEGLQTFTEKLGLLWADANIDLISPETAWEMVNAMGAGLAVGGAMGAGGKVVQKAEQADPGKVEAIKQEVASPVPTLPPLGSDPEVTGGPTVPPMEPMEPIKEPRGLEDIIASTLAQREAAAPSQEPVPVETEIIPPPDLVPEGDQGPRVPPIEPTEPIEEAPPEAEMAAALALEAEADRRKADRRKPGRPTIPQGIRGDEAATLKQLMRSGQAEEAEAFAGEFMRRAETDSLTGLRNQGAHSRAVDEADSSSRHAYVDLDDFKVLNDTYGHDVGDMMLAAAAEVIRDEAGQVEGFEGFRRGGDEFAILAGANSEQLEDVAERIRQRIADIEIEVKLSDGETAIGKVGASYGIGQTVSEADAALYKDKETKAERAAEPASPEPEAGGIDVGVDEEGAGGRPEGEVQREAEEVATEPALEEPAEPNLSPVLQEALGQTTDFNDFEPSWSDEQIRRALGIFAQNLDARPAYDAGAAGLKIEVKGGRVHPYVEVLNQADEKRQYRGKAALGLVRRALEEQAVEPEPTAGPVEAPVEPAGPETPPTPEITEPEEAAPVPAAPAAPERQAQDTEPEEASEDEKAGVKPVTEPSELESPAAPRRPLDPLDPEYDPHYTPRQLEGAGGSLTTNAPKVIDKAVKAAEELGVKAPVRVGVKGKRRKGFFKVRPEVVRIKTANDIETVAHELGHAIEKAVFGWVLGSPWTQPLATTARQNELLRLGKALYADHKPKAGYKREGWSEFFRLWMTTPGQARKLAPGFAKWFEHEWLPNQSDAARKALGAARDEAVLWFGQGSTARVKESIVDPMSAKNKLKRMTEKAKKFSSPEYTYEMLHPLHEIARAAERQFGRDLEADEDPFVIASALRKVHHGRVKEMAEHQMIDFFGNPVGPPLADIKPLVKGKYEEFWAYMYAKRAHALWTDPQKPEGRNPGITLEDANQVIGELETPQFINAAQKIYRWTSQTLDYAAQASPAFAAIVNQIRDVDPGSYIPLQRVFDEMTRRYGSGAGRGSITKRLTGSGRQIKDPLQELIAQTAKLVRAAHQERIIEALVKLEDVEGMGRFIERIPVDRVPIAKLTVKQMMDRINKQLEWEGAGVVGAGDFDQSMLDQAVTFFAPAKKAPGGKRILVRFNPETKRPVWYEVSDDLYEMLETMEPYRLPAVGEWLAGKPTALMRAGTVGYKASFQLVWNMIRDPQTMFMQTQTKAWAPRLLLTWADSMKDAALYRLLGRRTPALDAFVRLGGEMVQPLAQDINYTRRTARRMHQGRVVVVLDPHNWFDLFRDFIQFPELAPRITELKLLAKEHGIDINKPLAEKDAYFLLLAFKQVTTDFTSEGKVSRVMNRIVPFFGAQIQGPRATGRAYRRNPKRFIGRALQMSIFTVALWLRNRDEDWYIETPWREKFLHWQFEVDWPEPTIIRLPRAFEIGMAFSALPEALLDTWYRKDPEAAVRWAEIFADVLVPGFEPVLAREVRAQAKNMYLFWETPIVPRGELRGPPEEQYNEYTTRVAIKLGEWFKVSPRRIDHAIKGVAGTVPLDLLQVLGLGSKAMKREKTISDLPVIGRAFRREGKMGSRSISVDKVYDLHADAVMKGASKKTPETEEQRQRRLMLDDATDALSALSYTRRFTPELEKRQKIQALRVEIARKALAVAGEPVTPEIRGLFKAGKKKARLAELRSEVLGGRAGEPKDRSEAIRHALIKDPQAKWGDLYKQLEDAQFSRGRDAKDFRKRFYEIKKQLEEGAEEGPEA